MQTIAKNSATAALRRVKLSIWDSSNPLLLKDVTVTGLKPRIHYADGTSAVATNDIVKVGSGTTVQYYHEQTQAESNVALGNSALVLDPTALGGAMEVVYYIVGPLEAFDSPADPAGVTTLLSRVTAAVPLSSDYTPARAALIDRLDALVSGAATPTQVLAQINAALDAASTEIAAVPASTASLRDMFRWMFVKSRNKITQTATTQLVRDNADAATIGTSTVSDDGTTATRGKFS